MHDISIDDDPDHPVGTKPFRRAVAIKWRWTTEYTTEQIASALGVRPRTIRNYLSEEPTDEVREAMDANEGVIRDIAVAELKEQLRAAGHRSRTAETPVEVWTDADGDLRVNDKVNPETGELTGKYPVPADMELAADEQARYYARAEVREILDQLTDLVGAKEPEEHKVEHSGSLFDLPAEVTDHWERSDGDD